MNKLLGRHHHEPISDSPYSQWHELRSHNQKLTKLFSRVRLIRVINEVTRRQSSTVIMPGK